MRSPLLLLCVLTAIAAPLRAQTFDASHPSQSITTIDAPWRFHPGDDPNWASPAFDDSSWPLLQTGKMWSDQGYRGLVGYAWYRLRIQLPAISEPLGIDIGHINSTAELYADGQLIGAVGIMRPDPDWTMQLSASAIPIPRSLSGHSVEFAIRVWKSPVATSYSGGGLLKHPVVGSLALLQASRRLAIDNEFASDTSTLILDLLSFILGCFGLGLFLLDRRNIEYAWFAVWTIGSALLDIVLLYMVLHQGNVTFVNGDSQFLYLPIFLAENLFLWGFLKARADWLLATLMLFNVIGVAGNSLAYHNVISLPAGRGIMTGFFALVFLLVIVRVLLSLKAGSRDARLLIVPLCLVGLETVIDGVRQAIFFAGLSNSRGPFVLWSNGIVTVAWGDAFQALMLLSIAFAMLLRFTRSAQEERRLSTELAAARDVQLRLVPAHLPALRTLRLNAVYLPATEVGGDFYQVFPLPGDSTLIVIGDVSGKGLRAAMTGTLALGALRTLAQEDLSPSQILIRLNAQLAGSTDGGFITCLCARIAPDGIITIANAGHLAPYRAGNEIAVNSGLPLGLIPNAEYTETTLTLVCGETLTFLSDGVVEAQSETGELFGFDRAAAISTESAQDIASGAQHFGQQDDITVLQITREPSASETSAATASAPPSAQVAAATSA